MELIDPQAFGVQYKSRYVPKPVEAVAAMTETFNKRYEDAIASGSLIDQAVMAAQPATGGQVAELQRMAQEAKDRLNTVVETGNIRNVDLAAKAIATKFASSPELNLIAKSAEEIRRLDQVRNEQEVKGQKLLKNTRQNPDGTWTTVDRGDDFVGVIRNPDGTISAQRVEPTTAPTLNWADAAKLDMKADAYEGNLAMAVRAGADPAVVNAARGMLQVAAQKKLSPEKIAELSTAYAPVFANSPEGRQYIGAVRTGQIKPVMLENVSPEKIAQLSDNEIAALYVTQVNLPSQFTEISKQFIKGDDGGGSGAKPEKVERPINRPFTINTDPRTENVDRSMWQKVKDAVTSFGNTAALALGTPVAGTVQYFTEDKGNATVKNLESLTPEQYEVAEAVYSTMPQPEGATLGLNSKEAQAYLKDKFKNSGSLAMGISEYGEKDNTTLDFITNKKFEVFAADGRLLTEGLLTDLNTGKTFPTFEQASSELRNQASGKKDVKPIVVGRAMPGSTTSFFGGHLVMAGDKSYLLEPTTREQAALYPIALSNMMANTVMLGMEGGVPAMTHKVGKQKISTVAKKTTVPVTNQETGEVGYIWEVSLDEGNSRQVFYYNPLTGEFTENQQKRNSKPRNPHSK